MLIIIDTKFFVLVYLLSYFYLKFQLSVLLIFLWQWIVLNWAECDYIEEKLSPLTNFILRIMLLNITHIVLPDAVRSCFIFSVHFICGYEGYCTYFPPALSLSNCP
jgi:hypothetical protein